MPQPETVAPETIQTNRSIQSAWVKDGTPVAEPVTVETPAADPTPSATPAVPETPPSAAAASTPEPQGSGTVTMEQFIEARRGEAPFQLPQDVLVPMKRRGQVEYVPITEAINSGMLERDYRLKTDELGAQRRAFDDERATFASEKAQLEEDRKQLEAALRDQQKFDEYQEHLRLMEQNPMYRQAFEDQRAKRTTDARLKVYEEADQAAYVQQSAATVRAMIAETAARYPGVSPERVTERYGQYLRANREHVSLKPETVQAELDRLFSDEAGYIQTIRSPVTSEIESLKQQIAALTASIQTKNEQTTHAVTRSKAPNTAPLGSAPAPRTVTPPQRHTINEHARKNNEWARVR